MALRILLLTGWLLIGVAGAVAHLVGPGVEQQKLDTVATYLRAAEAAAADGDYALAVDKYNEALKALPEGRVGEARKIRLERAKAQMLARQLPDAHADLTALVDELAGDSSADPKLLADVRATMANSQYYLTWLMRLEGLGREAWEPEVEAARQTYKLLAEEAEKRGDVAAATKYREDLEASIRLARLELAELQGLPLPSQ
jgi:tetratricopeptide (TPR) repeat protein